MSLKWLRRFKPFRSKSKKIDQAQASLEGVTEPGAATGGQTSPPSGGFFNNTSNIVIGHAVMYDGAQFHQTVYNTVFTETAVLERLIPHTCPGAAVDSNARYPFPRCHPGTRQQIGNQLENWLDDPNRKTSMIWLNGLAGTGKSAIAQTFAEICVKRHRLGASFFFERNCRNDPNTIVPTIACQLTIYLPEYRPLLLNRITQDPAILEKAPHVQFSGLIVEPITALQRQGHQINYEPLVIVLDGLDECQGPDAQGEIVEMIGDAVRSNGGLPLLWLISSRPLRHLKRVFSMSESPVNCSWDNLLVDEARNDVDRYICDSFDDIRQRFPDCTKVSWPSDAQLKSVSDIANGRFVLASAIIQYVGDSTDVNPMGRLTEILALLENKNQSDGKSPLQMLDLLHSGMLGAKSEETLPMAK